MRILSLLNSLGELSLIHRPQGRVGTNILGTIFFVILSNEGAISNKVVWKIGFRKVDTVCSVAVRRVFQAELSM